jgi:tetratricopeptide (TPR) repeat protein
MGVARRTGMVLLGAGALCCLLADTIPKVKPPSPFPAQVAVERGVSSLNRGDLNAAESAFREGLRLQPNLIGALAGLADVAVRRGRASEAESYLQQALKLSPNSAAVQRSWARYLASQNRFLEAEAALKKAAALAPEAAAPPKKELGDLYLGAMNRPDKAVEAYRASLALEPNSPGAHFALGAAFAALHDSGGAEKELREAQRLIPNDPSPVHALGMLYLEGRQFSRALQAFSDALRIRPDFLPSCMARGETLEATREDDKALFQYSECLKAHPNFAAADVKIGVIHQRYNRLAEADKAYLAAISLDPNQVIAYNNLAFQAAQQKTRLDAALVWAKKAVQLQPQVAQFQDTLGWVLRARGDLDQASATLEKAAALDLKDPTTYYHLGVVYSEKRERREAVAALNRALTIKAEFPGAADARKLLAQLGRP